MSYLNVAMKSRIDSTILYPVCDTAIAIASSQSHKIVFKNDVSMENRLSMYGLHIVKQDGFVNILYFAYKLHVNNVTSLQISTIPFLYLPYFFDPLLDSSTSVCGMFIECKRICMSIPRHSVVSLFVNPTQR